MRLSSKIYTALGIVTVLFAIAFFLPLSFSVLFDMHIPSRLVKPYMFMLLALINYMLVLFIALVITIYIERRFNAKKLK